VWALLDGYYSYGVVSADRLTIPADYSSHASSLPWPVITLVFAGVLLWLYTRRVDYSAKLRIVALGGLTITLLTIYSKGYSPQFIVQLIPFAVLLLPNLKGVSYIILLDVINFLEATVYFIILPDQSWLLVITVLLRTLLLIALSFECGLLLFDVRSARFVKLHGRASLAVLVGVAVLLCTLVFPLGQAYVSDRSQADANQPLVGVYATSGTTIGHGDSGSGVAEPECRESHLWTRDLAPRRATYPLLGGEPNRYNAPH
jgi:hypothetical protein